MKFFTKNVNKIVILALFLLFISYRVSYINNKGVTHGDNSIYFASSRVLKSMIDWRLSYQNYNTFTFSVPESHKNKLIERLNKDNQRIAWPFGYAKSLYIMLITAILIVTGNLFPHVLWLQALLGVIGIYLFYVMCKLLIDDFIIRVGITLSFVLSGLSIYVMHSGGPTGFAYFFFLISILLFILYLKNHINEDFVLSKVKSLFCCENLIIYGFGVFVGLAIYCHPATIYYAILLILFYSVYPLVTKYRFGQVRNGIIVMVGIVTVGITIDYSIMLLKSFIMHDDFTWLFGGYPLMTNFEQLFLHHSKDYGYNFLYKLIWNINYLISGENIVNFFLSSVSVVLSFIYLRKKKYKIFCILSLLSLIIFCFLCMGNIYLAPRVICYLTPFFYLNILFVLKVVSDKYSLKWSVIILIICIVVQLWNVKPFILDKSPYYQIVEWMDKNKEVSILSNDDAGLYNVHNKDGYWISYDKNKDSFVIETKRINTSYNKIKDIKYVALKGDNNNFEDIRLTYDSIIEEKPIIEITYLFPYYGFLANILSVSEPLFSSNKKIMQKVNFLKGIYIRVELYKIKHGIIDSMIVKNRELD